MQSPLVWLRSSLGLGLGGDVKSLSSAGIMPADRDGFSVAVVCALESEAAAAEAVLDEMWSNPISAAGSGRSYKKPPHDPNEYSNGRIGGHPVVVAWMKGMGKGDAARSAAHLSAAYRNLDLVVLAGICGGLPRNEEKARKGREDADVLLGDVLIAYRIYEYDYGKEYPDGLKASLTKVSVNFNRDVATLIDSAVGTNDGDRLRDRLSEHLVTLLRKEDAAAARAGGGTGIGTDSMRGGRRSLYQRPDPGTDMLFPPDYLHMHRPGPPFQGGSTLRPICRVCTVATGAGGQTTCEAARTASCEEVGCDPAQLVRRPRLDRIIELHRAAVAGGSRKGFGDDGFPVQRGPLPLALRPAVHLGVMGTGDRVMKSARLRDKTATDEGGAGVVGVEMESAGIFRQYPGVVVKGVCDYADSHKNKAWQRYAAATAACAVKALLERITPTDTDGLPMSQRIAAAEADRLLAPKRAFPDKQPVDTFVDRDELVEMEEFIFKGQKKMRGREKRLMIWGMPGSGKTQLWLRFLQKNEDRLGDVFIVDASSRATVEKGFGDIAKWKKWKSPTMENGLEALRQSDDGWLLILDGAKDRELAQASYPRAAKGCVIVVTRDQQLLDDVHVISLKPLLADQAITLFLHACKEDAEEARNRELARPIVEELACLPVALSQAAVPIRLQGEPLAGYLDGYYRLKKLDLMMRPLEKDPNSTSSLPAYMLIGASLQTMLDLDRVDVSVRNRALWIVHLCAFVHFNAIPVGLFVTAPSSSSLRRSWSSVLGRATNHLPSGISWFWSASRNTGARALPRPGRADNEELSPEIIAAGLRCVDGLRPGDLVEATAVGAGVDQVHEVRHALQLLSCVGLGDYDKDAGTYSMQPLQHEWSRWRLDGNPAAAESARRAVGVALANLIPSRAEVRLMKSKEEAKRRALLPHVDFFLSSDQGGDGASDGSPSLPLLTADQARVAGRFALVYEDNGRYGAAEALHRAAWEGLRASLGEDSAESLRALHGIAEVLEERRDYEASAVHSRRAWEGLTAVGDDEAALESLNTYGAALHGLGRFTEAVEAYNWCLRASDDGTAMATARGQRPDTALSIEVTSNLAMALMRLGCHKEAVSAARRAHTWRLEHLGERHPDSMRSRRDLSLALRDAGELDKAATEGRRVLQLRREVLGAEHPDTLMSMAQLATVLGRQGQAKEAATLGHEAASSMRRLAGSDNPDTLECVSSVAAAAWGLNLYQDALDGYNAVLDGYKDSLGPMHPDTARAMISVALVLCYDDNDHNAVAKAETLYRTALTVFLATCAGDARHQDVVRCRCGLAHALDILRGPGMAEEAARIHGEIEAATEGTDAALFPGGPGVKRVWLWDYAICLRDLGKLKAAEKQARLALACAEDTDGVDSAAVLEMRGCLAFILDLQGPDNYEAAWVEYEHTIRGFEVLPGPRNYHAGKALERFGQMRAKMREMGISAPPQLLNAGPCRDAYVQNHQGLSSQKRRASASLSPPLQSQEPQQVNTKRRRMSKGKVM